MSREIKFRAWLKPRWDDDEDANKMYYNVQNSYDNLGDVTPYDPMDNFSSWFNDDVAIVEQYTGLKDKNGKEIYEGDIITETIDDGDIGVHQTYEVYWDEDQLLWAIRGVHSYDYNLHDELWQTNMSCEVIGNVHETTELVGSD